MPEPMVGDEILVRGTVVRHVPGYGTLVEFFSQTDQYEAWVRNDLVVDIVLPRKLPGEPVDGTMLHGGCGEDGNASIFRRHDAEGLSDDKRRHDEHWWDYVAQQWIDWPTAVGRGANVNERLVRE